MPAISRPLTSAKIVPKALPAPGRPRSEWRTLLLVLGWFLELAARAGAETFTFENLVGLPHPIHVADTVWLNNHWTNPNGTPCHP